MSGYGGPDLQAEAEAAGARAVLSKPLAAADLAHCLAQLFAGGLNPTPVSPAAIVGRY